MKAVLIIIVLVLSAGSLFAFSFGFNLGITPMTQYLDYTNKIAPLPDPLWSARSSQNHFSFGLFFDLDYVRLTVSGQGSIGTVNIEGLTNGIPYTNGVIVSNSTVYLNLEILGKLPIKITEGFVLWPAIGLEYCICFFDGQSFKNSINNVRNNDRNDLYLKAGLGADIKLGERLALVPLVLLGYNLTPVPYQTTDENIKIISGYSTYADWRKIEEFNYNNIKFDFILGLAFHY